MLEVVYLAHSGFAVLAENATIVIDYYSDSCQGDRCLSNGVVDADLLCRPGRFYVLCSHGHADHFNPIVLEWRKKRPDIVYLFSRDLLSAGMTAAEEALYVEKGHTYADECMQLSVFGSTDLGVSFVCKLAHTTFLHAGDLNNWHWNEEVSASEAAGYEQAYRKELQEISTAFAHLDLAMFPVDPRLGKDYMRGAQQLVDAIEVDCFVPMHFGGAFAKANAFAPFVHHRFVPLFHRGDRFTVPLEQRG